MKLIYFVQHGKAFSKDIDKARPLSTIGIEETHQIATKLKHQNIVINKISHSDKLRAVQTAKIFAEILNVDTVAELSGLAPNDSPDMLIQQINDDAVLYIGHLPNIQKVVSKLITNDENSDAIKFCNSAVACLEMKGNVASLKWFLTP